MVTQEAKVVGRITPLGVLKGSAQATGTLRGSASIPKGYSTYSGEYTVTPETYQEVSLKTQGYLMADNVTVQKIPQFEVSNDAGGATLIIGEEYYKHG